MATACLSLTVWMNEYLDEVKTRYSKKTYEEKRMVFRRFIAFTKYPMEKPVEEIDRDMVRSFFRHLANTISGHAANKARKNLGAAWRWGERNIEGWPYMPNLFLAIERFKEEKKPRYVPPEEDFWKVYHQADEQDKVMLLAFFHLGARRKELFKLKWSHIDFSRKQVYLRQADGRPRGGLDTHDRPTLPGFDGLGRKAQIHGGCGRRACLCLFVQYRLL